MCQVFSPSKQKMLLSICICVCVCVCVRVCIYAYVYAYVYMYIYITQLKLRYIGLFTQWPGKNEEVCISIHVKSHLGDFGKIPFTIEQKSMQ